MRALRILRSRLMFRWIWQDANQLTDVVTLTRELSDFADAVFVPQRLLLVLHWLLNMANH